MLEEGEVEGVRREGLAEVEGERMWGREEDVCYCERVRKEQRMRR